MLTLQRVAFGGGGLWVVLGPLLFSACNDTDLTTQPEPTCTNAVYALNTNGWACFEPTFASHVGCFWECACGWESNPDADQAATELTFWLDSGGTWRAQVDQWECGGTR